MDRNRKLFHGLLCSVVVMAIALPSQAPARSGRLDSNFGTRGKVVVALDFGDPRFWYAVRVQASHMLDGGIVVAGDNLVLRFLPSGRIDRRFAQGGILRIESGGGQGFELSDLAVDPSGRIVVAGTSRPPQGAQEAMILRFKPSGMADTSFGEDGAVVTDFGVKPLPDGSLERASLRVTGVAVDAGGRIAVSGSALRAQFYCAEQGGFVGRLTADGNVDPSFGTDGSIVYEGSIMHSADGLVLDSSGAPLFFGWDGYCHGGTDTYSLFVNRLSINGSPDAGFGQEGQVAVNEYPRQIALDRSGRILVLQRHNLVRLLPSGATDGSFGKDGATAALLPGMWSGWDDLAVTRNGGVLVTGHQVHFFGKPEPRRRLVLARLNPHGELGRSFGNAGIARTRFGRPSNTVGRQVLLDGKGHAIVVGTVRNRKLSTGEGLALFRYELKP
jgi:uncharacterized delta-60 repeat protein